MKLNGLTRLSTAAAILLQLGTFVHAGPMFEEHSNAADPNSCQDLRVTYPAGSAIAFEENTKHLIAWIPPLSLQQINITLADANQETVNWVGLYDAQKGAAGEVDILLNGQQPGVYHFHLAGIGASNCEVDSDPFQVTAAAASRTVEEATTQKFQQTTSSTDETDKHNNEWFTNEDQRTHIDKTTNAELDALVDDGDEKQQHNDAGAWFTNDDERTHFDKEFLQELEKLQEGNANHEDALESWIAEEIEVPSGKYWRDDSPNVPNHSNVGEWIAEELEQQHMDAEGFYVEEHVDDHQIIDIIDYSSEGSFAAEDVDQREAEAYVPSHEDGWVSDDDSNKPFDHSNVSPFIAEEIDAENAAPNDHEDVTGWIAEEIVESDHPNEAWTEHVDDQPEPVEENWVEESEHVDGAWTDESPHIDEVTWVAEEVDENGASEHPNETADEWHVHDAEEDPNWHVDEEPSANWNDESSAAADVPDHTDESPITWEEVPVEKEDNTQDNHVDAAEQWIEETVHSNAAPSGKPSTGYMSQENTHNDSVNAPDQPQNLVANW